MGEARMKPALAALAVALPLLAGCLVPDAPFKAAGPRPAAEDPKAAPAPLSTGTPGRPPPTSPVYSIPHSAPPAPGEVLSAPPTKPAGTPADADPPGAPPASSGPDTCGATELGFLVGKPRTEIPVPADLTHRRVVCTTCPITPDVRPERQTITYDAATNRVTRVTCG